MTKYTSDSKFRMIYVANGRWRLQQRDEAKATRTFDPWYGVGPAGDHATIAAELRARDPFKPRVPA